MYAVYICLWVPKTLAKAHCKFFAIYACLSVGLSISLSICICVCVCVQGGKMKVEGILAFACCLCCSVSVTDTSHHSIEKYPG